MGRKVLLTINGESHTLREWAALSGISFNTLQSRLHHAHWPVDRLLEPPQRVSWRQLRTCRKCGQRKSVDDFVPVYESQTVRGTQVRYTCKTCEHARTMDWRRHDPLRGKRPKERFRAYRKEAQARGLVFTLTFDQFFTFWKQPCTYCTEPIHGVGLDRRDNTLGYILENVVPCCWLCNQMKRDLPVEVFLAHVLKVAQVHLRVPPA